MWVFSFEAFVVVLLLLFRWGESWLLLSTVGLVYSSCSCGAAQGPQNPDRECVLWGAGCAWAGLNTELVPVLQPNPAGQAASEHGERAVWNQEKTSGTNSTDKVFKSPPRPFSYCLGILGNTQLYSFLFLSENQTMILVSHFKVDFESLVSSIPSHFSVSYVLF